MTSTRRWLLRSLQGLRSGVNKLLSQGLSTEARKIAREEFRSLGNCLGLLQSDNWQFVRTSTQSSPLRGGETTSRSS